MPSDQESHDAEVAGQNVFRNDRTVASFYWHLQRDGVTFLQERDECDCDDKAAPDPTGHIHRITEWPGKPSLDGAPVFHATEDFEPFTLVASPMCLSHQTLPDDISFEIGKGDAGIWEHRLRANQVWVGDGDGAHLEDRSEMTMAVGVEHADGTQAISLIYADGSVHTPGSVEDARAHFQGESPHDLPAGA